MLKFSAQILLLRNRIDLHSQKRYVQRVSSHIADLAGSDHCLSKFSLVFISRSVSHNSGAMENEIHP
jgi:hypothetical protein